LSEPKPKSQTARQALLEALRAHLEHLERSLARGELELRVEPPRCQECGFGFKKRERLGRPSRCPRCRSERLDSPLFSVKPR
jgi:predicted Zn-ribbon and HTH transcriptional regulator